MDISRKPESAHLPQSQPDQIHCPRIGRTQSVEEHLACPYCYGKERQVEGGDRTRFCDFQPDKDPINFGFPPDSTRLSEG